MQDSEHDALHIPGLGEASTSAVIGENSNKLLVVATLAALSFAGSAFAYRNRSSYFSSATTPLLSAPSQKDKSGFGSSKSTQKKKSDSQRDDAEANDQNSDAPGSASIVSGSTSPATFTHDMESTNQSKTSRRKDRRKRGKDPLKEMLKGGKKFKALAPSFAGSASKDPAAGALSTAKSNIPPSDSGNAEFGVEHADDQDTASQASSSTSHFTPDSQQNHSRSKGKQAQREELNGTDVTRTTEEEEVLSVGNTSVSRHIRGTSTSEVSQKQYLQQSSDGPSSSFYSFSKNRTSFRSESSNPDETQGMAASHPLNSYGQRIRSHSPLSASTSRRATSHADIDDHDESNNQAADLEQKDYLTEESQVHQLGLADVDTTSEADFVGGSRLKRTGLETQIANDRSRSSISMEIPFDASTVETSSTATAPASMSSSLVLSSPATSPTLSSSLYSIEQSNTDVKPSGEDNSNDRVDDISALHQPRRDKTASNSEFTLPSSSSSFTSSSTTTGKADPRKPPQTETQGGNSNKGNSTSTNPASDPWDWDRVVSSATVERREENPKEKTNDKLASKNWSRLPPASLKSGPSFSAVAGAGISSSATHPASFYSPTKSNFAASISNNLTPGSPMTSSISATGTTSASTRVTTAPLGTGLDVEPEGPKQRENDDAFVFPTLNPTTITNGNPASGSSRPSTSRRAPTPRRPGTPSRSSTTGTPPPPSSSSSSSVAGVNTTSSSYSNSHGTYNNNVNTTPISGSNSSNSMPALSTQTQLASLRGALEAARLREEKNKADTEKYIKELDMLRWENANWRRGEVELKAHVQHLMHQLQAYAAFYNTAAPHLNPQFQQQLNGNNVPANPASSGASTSSAPNGIAGTSGSTSVPTPQSEQASSSTSPVTSTFPNTQPSQTRPPSQASSPAIPHPPAPLHLHQMAALQMNGTLSSPGILSPVAGMFSPAPGGGSIGSPTVMGMHPGTPSFFPYPIPHPPHPMVLQAQQMHMMQQQLHHQQQQSQQSALPSPHQANIFSSIFPPGAPPPLMSPHQQHQYPAFATAQAQIQQVHVSSSTSHLASGPSSTAGSSSAGSLSPDLNGTSSPGGQRSRQKTNGRTLGRKSWEDIGDGWIDGGGEERNGNVGEKPATGDEDDSGINELLADAILKRPGSIRMRSSSSRRGQINFEQETKTEPDTQDDASPVEPSDENTEVEQLTEFTFPSISNHYKGYGSSIDDISFSMSPSSTSLDSNITREANEVLAGQSKTGVLTDMDEPASEDSSSAALIDDVVDTVTSPSSQESDTTPRKEILESTVIDTTVDHEHGSKQQRLPTLEDTQDVNAEM